MAFVFKRYVLCEFADADPNDDQQTIRSLAVIPSAWVEMGQLEIGNFSDISDLKGVTVGVWWPTMKIVPEDFIIKTKSPNKATWTRLSAKIVAHSSK